MREHKISRAPLGQSCMIVMGVVGLVSGCSHVPAYDQAMVSKPNMIFSESPVFDFGSKVLPRIEPGASASGGAQAAGCATCR